MRELGADFVFQAAPVTLARSFNVGAGAFVDVVRIVGRISITPLRGVVLGGIILIEIDSQ